MEDRAKTPIFFFKYLKVELLSYNQFI